MVAHEILDQTACRGDVIVLVGGHDVVHQRVEQGNDPSVKLRPLLIRNQRRCRVEIVHIRVEREERICVVESAEELSADFVHSGFVETEIVPGLGVGEHIPAERIRPEVVQRLEWIDGVAEPLAHLVAVLVEHQSVGNHSLERALSGHHRADGVESVEPSPGLVHSLGDEVSRLSEALVSEIAQAFLGVRHRTRVEPHVDEVGLAGHLPAGVGHEENLIHIWPVQVDAAVVLLGHILRIESFIPERVGHHHPGCHGLVDLGVELLERADAFLFLAVLAAPYGQRCAPIAAAAEVPVLDVLKPFPETSAACGLRLPDDGVVELHHLLPHRCGTDEPGVERVVEDRFVGSPAVRICVGVLFNPEGLALLLQHNAEVNVKCGGVRRQSVVVGILHIASGPFPVLRCDELRPVCRVDVLQTEEAALAVHEGAAGTVAVKQHHRRNA